MITSELDDDIKNTCGAEWAEAVVGSSGAHLHTPEKEAERDAASDAAWEVKYRVFAGIVLDKNCRAAAELLRSTQAHLAFPKMRPNRAKLAAAPLRSWLGFEAKKLAGDFSGQHDNNNYGPDGPRRAKWQELCSVLPC